MPRNLASKHLREQVDKHLNIASKHMREQATQPSIEAQVLKPRNLASKHKNQDIHHCIEV